jgi:hypothetical protein
MAMRCAMLRRAMRHSLTESTAALALALTVSGTYSRMSADLRGANGRGQLWTR